MKPEILTHPHIPKPLHGLNPREILGKEWWDKGRFEAQKRTNHTCVACGIKKEDAKKYQWLEGHEYWDINYMIGRCKVVSIEPLCHYCHNFIHSGRLEKIMGKEKSINEVKEILEHGFKILSENKLRCFPFTLELGKKLKVNTYNVEAYLLPESKVKWGDWILIIENKEYKSKFKNIDEWYAYYNI